MVLIVMSPLAMGARSPPRLTIDMSGTGTEPVSRASSFILSRIRSATKLDSGLSGA